MDAYVVIFRECTRRAVKESIANKSQKGKMK